MNTLTLEDLRMGKHKVGICVSGGLDSLTITKRLIQEGIKVLCFTADLGQPDEGNIQDVAERMKQCGAQTIIVDLKQEMADACIDAVTYQAKYDGGYWNTTGIGRAITAIGLAKVMKKHGCTVLAHGATGRGNDQMRFQKYATLCGLKVYAPWRDPVLLEEFPGRTQMLAYLRKHGIKRKSTEDKSYSTDANIGGLSHEAGDLESLQTSCGIVKPIMGVWPQNAPDKEEYFSVLFVRGELMTINDKRMSNLTALTYVNKIAGRNGIGIKHALENRIVGTKSRGVYEAPGMELLGKCLEFLYQAVIEKHALGLFKDCSTLIAKNIYEGRYYNPSTNAARTAIKELTTYATGCVGVTLYKGNIFFASLTGCPHSLYSEDDASMEASKGLNPVTSEGYAQITQIEDATLVKAGQIKIK